jgi:hypothetical protein
MYDVQVRPSRDLSSIEDNKYNLYIVSELKKAEAKAQDPETKWFTHDEVWGEIRRRRNNDV